MDLEVQTLSQVAAAEPCSRRSFLRRSVKLALGATAVAGLSAVGYGFWEANQIRIARQTIVLPRLPKAFAGKTIAILSDFHHGPFVGLRFIREAVSLAASLKPDAFALIGDFADKGTDPGVELPQCMEALGKLHAPLGVFAVAGNHDHQVEGAVYGAPVVLEPLTNLTNRAECFTMGGQNLWLAGVDDLLWGLPNLKKALAGIPDNEAVVLLSHNPDLAEVYPDDRVDLILSGHMHGGQVYLPGIGAPWVPSMYGQKYCSGLVQGPASQVFVSRGLGETGIPLRMNCPPEINLLTLAGGSQVS
jgi:predicted MPP superfamily phosphohydrolase